MDEKFFLNSREIKDKNQSEDSLKMVKTIRHTDKKRDYYYHRQKPVEDRATCWKPQALKELCEIVKKHGSKDFKKIARLLGMTYVQVATKLHAIKNMKNVNITDEEF